MAQERLFMRPHMNVISYHCLLDTIVILQPSSLKTYLFSKVFGTLALLYNYILFRHIYHTLLNMFALLWNKLIITIVTTFSGNTILNLLLISLCM